MNSLNKIVLLGALSLCTAPVFSMGIFKAALSALLLGTPPVFSMDIFKAAGTGDVGRVQELIRQDPHVVNKQDKHGQTPLQFAAFNGHVEVVNALIAAGANVNQKEACDWTPLHAAAAHGHSDIVEMLLAHGAKASVNQQDIYGNTPLHDAASWGYSKVVELLLAHGASVNKQDNGGRTPLHMATWYIVDIHNQLEVVRVLLAHGANPSITNTAGKSALEIAVCLGKDEIAEMLLDAMLQQQAKQQRDKRQAIATALAAATHARLGESSPAGWLSQDLMKYIAIMAERSER
jgi:ankyrin repeat protein